ncbi:hypothetical protein E1B28_005872 [Marasmius oreades]|uniref:Uncharacterized protein n=1 Tax=Marasmius oreades TaxID=181124 RepID=A0A9P7S457_9AGAR|nr:uncharacterized protein E1B28_005872 [Marasmius oreades]KAG7095084.1 hypothetical protein E1B28_005872 [Marasmius oreades]
MLGVELFDAMRARVFGQRVHKELELGQGDGSGSGGGSGAASPVKFLMLGFWSQCLLHRTYTSPPTIKRPDVVQHTQDLLDKSLAFYLPKSESPDSDSIRDFAKSKHPSEDLDDILSPLIILATHLCIGDVSARNRICNWIVLEDMERDPEKPLDERPNILGRYIRLMGSVYHKRLNESTGELLYAMCRQDAGVLCSKVGYGHVAG